MSLPEIEKHNYSMPIFIAIIWLLLNIIHGCQAQTNGAPLDGPKIVDVSIKIEPEICSLFACYLPTNTELNITAQIEDKSYFDNTTVFKWAINNSPIAADQHASEIKYTFKTDYNDSLIQVNVTHPKTNATGSAGRNFIVESPIVVSDPIGKLFLEFGELLNVKLKFSGTPPFKYCYKICSQHDIIPCNFCLISDTTDAHEIPITLYIHSVGNYTLFFQISNHINSEQKYYAIKINDTVRQSTLPIAPIVSSILAVMILMTGIALHLRYRETSYNTEIANFDFVREYEEDWEEELSFIQRVKYLFCRGDEQDDAEESQYLLSNKNPVISTNGRPR